MVNVAEVYVYLLELQKLSIRCGFFQALNVLRAAEAEKERDLLQQKAISVSKNF